MTEAQRIQQHAENIRELLAVLELKPDEAHHVLRHAALIRYELARIVNAPQVKAGAEIQEP